MKIFAFVDMHGSSDALKKIEEKSKEVDIVICAGDFSIFEEKMDYYLSHFDKLNKIFLIIHGNHEDDSSLRKHCEKYKNLFFLHNNYFVKDDVLFLGWGGGGFSFKDKQFEKATKKFHEVIKKHKKKAVVLVTHAPPYKTKLDEVYGEHCGNKSIRNFIKKNKIDLAISGHLHENQGKQDKIGMSTIINPGHLGKVIKI